jgi:hypothetical protein
LATQADREGEHHVVIIEMGWRQDVFGDGFADCSVNEVNRGWRDALGVDAAGQFN